MTRRAAIYARVSTGRQAAGELSLPDQERRCREFAKSKNFEVADVFVDAGASARSDNRPAFQRMIALACAPHRPFDVILVHSQSRFARNAKDLLVYKEKFAANRVALLSITQDLGESEAADVMLAMMGVFDEYQSKETAKHVKRSMIENAKQGFWNGSTPPFGYQTYIAETRGAKAKKKIKVNETEAEIVRLIFQLYVFGAKADQNSQSPATGPLGVKQITTRLNGAGYKTREGRPFRLQYIDKILRNTAYVGEHYFNKRDSRRKVARPRAEWVAFPMPRLVDDALFYAAQEKLDRQHPLKTPPRLVRSSVLLTALAKCGLCGAPMRKQSGKYGKYHYYRCSKKCDAGETACKGVSIPMGELDGIVLDALEETVLEPNRLCKVTQSLAARAHEKNTAVASRLKDMDGEKRKIKKQLAELYRRVGDGEIDMDPTLTQHLKDLQEAHASLARRMAHLEQERNLPVESITDATAEQFGAAVKSALRNNRNKEFAKAYI